MFQLHAVVDTGVPGGVATGARLEFGASKESEKKVDLEFPLELILLLCGIVGACWLRRTCGKPAGNVTEGREQADTRSTLRARLRISQYCLGLIEGRRGHPGFRQADDGDGGHRVPRQEHLERKCTIKRLIPGSNSAGKHSTHW